jgi:LysR family glycine cleavage system transcriptional activator
LKNTNLLHDTLPEESLSSSWKEWLFERNIYSDDVDYTKGYRFDQADLIVRAAIGGQGVALAHHVLVAKEIERGRLVRIFDEISPCENVYVLYPKEFPNRPQINSFYDWISSLSKVFEEQYNVEKLIKKA